MARRRKYQRGGDNGGTRTGGDTTYTGESHESQGGNSSDSNYETQSTVDGNSSGSKDSGDSNRAKVKRKKSCKSLTGIARVKCVLSKYKEQSGPVGPNIL